MIALFVLLGAVEGLTLVALTLVWRKVKQLIQLTNVLADNQIEVVSAVTETVKAMRSIVEVK